MRVRNHNQPYNHGNEREQQNVINGRTYRY